MRYCALALFLVACSTPDPLTDTSGENLSKIAGGPTSGESKSVGVQPALAASYMADATAVATSVSGADITKTNTAGAPTVVGFSFAGSIGSLQKALAEAADASPTMRALQQQLDRLVAAVPPDEAAITATIDAIRTEEAALREALTKAGGDLSGLQTLTQVFTVVTTGGSDDAISDAAAEQLGKVPDAAKQAAGIVEEARK
jgi:hypothetical protein